MTDIGIAYMAAVAEVKAHRRAKLVEMGVAPTSSAGYYYAGVGSRETPADVQDVMRQAAITLGRLDWTLRTGAAQGADSAFFDGAYNDDQYVEVYLPWMGFGGHPFTYRRHSKVSCVNVPSRSAAGVAAYFHPAWTSLAPSARKLLARNSHQMFGKLPPTIIDKGHTPVGMSAFVLCWTADGAVEKTTSKTGGTGQVIRIANYYGVPVFNLARAEHRKFWEEFL